jgi:hypothetical protein
MQTAADVLGSFRRFSESAAMQERTEVHLSILLCTAQRVFDSVTDPQKSIVSGVSFPFVPVAIVDEVDGRIESGGESADAVESKREATHSCGRDGGHLWQSIFL